MATYADLKQRIVTEMSRDDLADDLATLLAQHIAETCDFYSDMRFWFNQIVEPIVTVSGDSEVAVPATVRIVDRVAGPYGDLTPVTLTKFTDAGETTRSGTPTSYTWLSGNLRFDPVPDDAIDMTIYGIAQIDAPANDADSNAWTNEAAGLIVNHTKMTLYSGQLRDAGGASAAADAVRWHLDQLKRKTTRRLYTRPVAQLVRPNGQPVRVGYLDRL